MRMIERMLECKLRNSLTLDQCQDDWEDIPALVRRHQQPSRSWATDTGYGISNVYIDAAGLPEDYVPRINQLHGLFLGICDDWIKRSEIAFRSVPASFVHNEAQCSQFTRLFGDRRRFILAPHPYHYVLENYSGIDAPERSGSVFFMPHTVHVNKPRLSRSFALRVLRDLPERFHPIDICLHPAEVNPQAIKDITNAGFGVVCAGGRHDPLFLHRFFWIVRRRRYALAVDFSTHVIFSSLTGLEIKVLREIPSILWDHAINSLWYAETPAKPFWLLFEEFHAREPDQLRFREAASYTMGADISLPADELRKLFLRAEAWYEERKTPNGHWALSSRDWSYIEPQLRHLMAIRQALRNRLSGNRGRIQPVYMDIWWELIKYEHSFSSEKVADPVQRDS